MFNPTSDILDTEGDVAVVPSAITNLVFLEIAFVNVTSNVSFPETDTLNLVTSDKNVGSMGITLVDVVVAIVVIIIGTDVVLVDDVLQGQELVVVNIELVELVVGIVEVLVDVVLIVVGIDVVIIDVVVVNMELVVDPAVGTLYTSSLENPLSLL